MAKHALIRVYGDSLSMPRYDDGIPYEETYPELVRDVIQRAHPSVQIHVFNRSAGAATSVSLLEQYTRDNAYFGPSQTDMLVIQCGVCDCAPRPIPPNLRWALERSPSFIRTPIVVFLHRNRARLIRGGFLFRNVQPESFKKALRSWLDAAARDSRQVFVLNIAPTTEKIEQHSPCFMQSITAYNQIIADVVQEAAAHNVTLLDVHSAISESPRGKLVYINENDGHHLTGQGHRLYASLLCEQEPLSLATGYGSDR